MGQRVTVSMGNRLHARFGVAECMGRVARCSMERRRTSPLYTCLCQCRASLCETPSPSPLRMRDIIESKSPLEDAIEDRGIRMEE